MGHTGSAFYLWLSFVGPLRVHLVWIRPNDSCSLNRSPPKMKERHKYGDLQLKKQFPVLTQIEIFFYLFCTFIFLKRVFKSLMSRCWRSMTETVVHKSPSPWSVSACLFWDETTAIRSSAPRIPDFSARFSSQTPHTQLWSFALALHIHFKPSGLFSGKAQIKHY